MQTKAILIVSHGTDSKEAYDISIGAIKQDIASVFPDYRIYQTWTGKATLLNHHQRNAFAFDNIHETMERMIQDNILDIVVQPTFIIDGFENKRMKEEILVYKDVFRSVRFGAPLLTDERDLQTIINVITEQYNDMKKEEALVLMAHGTNKRSNSIFTALNYAFREYGYPNIFLGTIKASPSLETLIKFVNAYHPERIILAPFMVTAGYHIKHDMIGDTPESWHSRLSQEGYKVKSITKGLGEYPGIRKLFISHVQEVVTVIRKE